MTATRISREFIEACVCLYTPAARINYIGLSEMQRGRISRNVPSAPPLHRRNPIFVEVSDRSRIRIGEQRTEIIKANSRERSVSRSIGRGLSLVRSFSSIAKILHGKSNRKVIARITSEPFAAARERLEATKRFAGRSRARTFRARLATRINVSSAWERAPCALRDALGDPMSNASLNTPLSNYRDRRFHERPSPA